LIVAGTLVVVVTGGGVVLVSAAAPRVAPIVRAELVVIAVQRHAALATFLLVACLVTVAYVAVVALNVLMVAVQRVVWRVAGAEVAGASVVVVAPQRRLAAIYF